MDTNLKSFDFAKDQIFIFQEAFFSFRPFFHKIFSKIHFFNLVQWDGDRMFFFIANDGKYFIKNVTLVTI
jgi:hypothetical protein